MVSAMFDPVLLRSFVAVVDCGNFTRAAERLHLTQSTVSQQIRRLEEAVACQLLDRDQRHVVATAEGERLLAYARRILALHEEAADVLINQQSDGVLRLSTQHSGSGHEARQSSLSPICLTSNTSNSPLRYWRCNSGPRPLVTSRRTRA